MGSFTVIRHSPRNISHNFAEKQRGQLYGIKMEMDVFDFTLFFLVHFSFSPYDILQVPINLGSWVSAFFLRNLPCLKNIQFDWSQFEWFDSQENQ